jgi:2-polyprenyl-6-hydroxyphenyl methylase/3-demethylubiquinone-9 3-methyltransferase
LHAFDLRDVDATPDQLYAVDRLNYMVRLNFVLDAVRQQVARGGSVLEIGCAQANNSLLLAEEGFNAVAVDINAEFIDYARQKYESGNIEWVTGNAFEVFLGEREFDAVILGEILEHVAHPGDLLGRALSLLKVGGVLVITTPNQEFWLESTPPFTDVQGIISELERRQFGPLGEDHLFTLRMEELRALIPTSAEVVRASYFGSVLFNRRMASLWRRSVPRRLLYGLVNLTGRSALAPRLCSHLGVVLRKGPQRSSRQSSGMAPSRASND